MPIFPMTLIAGAGLLLAVAIAGFIHSFLTNANKHENRLLPLFLLFWVLVVVVFAVAFPLLLQGKIF